MRVFSGKASPYPRRADGRGENREPDAMTKIDVDTRHASLQRAERAAGEAFGWPEAPVETVRRSLFLNPTTIAAATAVTTVAATLTYFV